ncbi:MFS transporter [Acidobacteriota bacterium]
MQYIINKERSNLRVITNSIFNRRFIIAFIGYFFLFMSVTLFFIFPLFLEQFNTSKSRIGLIMGIQGLMAIFIRPIFGRLIDIKGRKKISLAGIGIMIITVPLYHFVQDAGAFPMIIRAMMGIGWGISMTATMTICSDLAPVTRLAQSMGIIGVGGLLSGALGPLLGEEIVTRFGFKGLFNTSLIFLLISFMCMLITKEITNFNNSGRVQKKRLFGNVSVLTALLVAGLCIVHGSVRGSVVYFIALFGKSILLERVGPFFVSFSFAAIMTRVFLGDISDRRGRKQVIIPAALIVCLNLLLISQLRSGWVLIAVGFIGGFAQGLIFPALSTYIIDFLGRENKGLALSFYLTFFDFGMGFGTAFFGWIADMFGYRNMYLTGSGILLIVSLLFAWKAPPPDSMRNN